MTVYVDTMNARYGRMIMCHMIADSLEELHEMADLIQVNRKWFQNKSIPHYDICLAKKRIAIKNGAKEISSKELVLIARNNK